jgi:hypothetical protein
MQLVGMRMKYIPGPVRLEPQCGPYLLLCSHEIALLVELGRQVPVPGGGFGVALDVAPRDRDVVMPERLDPPQSHGIDDKHRGCCA